MIQTVLAHQTTHPFTFFNNVNNALTKHSLTHIHQSLFNGTIHLHFPGLNLCQGCHPLFHPILHSFSVKPAYHFVVCKRNTQNSFFFTAFFFHWSPIYIINPQKLNHSITIYTTCRCQMTNI